jgi:hypothetical protein
MKLTVYRSRELVTLDARSISDVIDLQSGWYRASQTTQSQHDGFLATLFTPDELSNLFAKDGTLYVLYDANATALAFGLMLNIVEFTNQYANDRGEIKLSSALNLETFQYLYQLVVRRGHTRIGLGQRLLTAMLASTDCPVIADVISKPTFNKGSYEFFRSNGFEEVGTMELRGYRNFGPLTSIVLATSNGAHPK